MPEVITGIEAADHGLVIELVRGPILHIIADTTDEDPRINRINVNFRYLNLPPYLHQNSFVSIIQIRA